MVLSGYLIERVGETVTLQTKAMPHEDIIFNDSIYLRFTAEEIRPENWFMTEARAKSSHLCAVDTKRARTLSSKSGK